MNDKTLGQIGWEAYRGSIEPSVQFEFKDIPKHAQNGWHNAAHAICEKFKQHNVEMAKLDDEFNAKCDEIVAKSKTHTIEPKPETKVNPGDGFVLLQHYTDSIKRGDEILTKGGWVMPQNETVGRIYIPGMAAMRRRK